MKKVLFNIILAIMSISLSVDVVAEDNVRLMTYNIKGHSITAVRLGYVADIINANCPDIVALQEVDNRLPSGKKYDQLADLAEQTGMVANFFPLVYNTSGYGYYGIGVLSKTQPLSVQTQSFPFSDSTKDKEDRGFLIVEFEDFYFISTHYSLNADDRDTATEWAVEFAYDSKKTVIIAGDFNAKPTYRAMVTFKNNGFEILNDTNIYTYPSDEPTSCIDMFISYSENIGNKKYEVVESGIADAGTSDLTVASDHLPVYLDLKPVSSFIEDMAVEDVKVNRVAGGIAIDGLNGSAEVVVSDLAGRIVAKSLSYTVGDVLPIYSSGLYIVSVKSGHNTYTFKSKFNN